MADYVLHADRLKHGRCICCGLPGSEEHHGQMWCDICVGRGHHEDGPMEPEVDDDE